VFSERDRMLALLFQFPISFKFTTRHKKGDPVRQEGNWDHVADVLNAFRDYPKAIEFRHDTWDDPWVLSALREHETAWVNIDEPRLGASLHRTEHVTAPLAYMRLHGRNYKKWFNSKNRDERYDYLYTPEELAPIAKSIETLAAVVDREPAPQQRKGGCCRQQSLQGQSRRKRHRPQGPARGQRQPHPGRAGQGVPVPRAVRLR